MFIHLEVQLGVVQAQGSVICAPRLQVAGNAIQSKHILHNLHDGTFMKRHLGCWHAVFNSTQVL